MPRNQSSDPSHIRERNQEQCPISLGRQTQQTYWRSHPISFSALTHTIRRLCPKHYSRAFLSCLAGRHPEDHGRITPDTTTYQFYIKHSCSVPLAAITSGLSGLRKNDHWHYAVAHDEVTMPQADHRTLLCVATAMLTMQALAKPS